MIQTKDLPPPEDRYPVRRALLSVSDKTGLADFAQRLAALGVELVSTGGTARALRDAGLTVRDVAEVTASPELLDGRVKTLHPKIHAGLLARRNDADDLAQLAEHGIAPIDLVVVNLYPFAQAVAREGVTDAEAIENVDIGGPTMVRAGGEELLLRRRRDERRSVRRRGRRTGGERRAPRPGHAAPAGRATPSPTRPTTTPPSPSISRPA